MSSFTKKAIEASFLKLWKSQKNWIVTNVRCFTYGTPETGSDLKGIFCLPVPSGQFSAQTVIPLPA